MRGSYGSACDSEFTSQFSNTTNSTYTSDHASKSVGSYVSKFGEFKDSYDWVECDSRNDPGRKYFFNLRNFCSTWDRPVPDDVPLVHYFHQHPMDDLESDPEDLLITLSENEQNNQHNFEEQDSLSSENNWSEFGLNNENVKVLKKWYHGVDIKGTGPNVRYIRHKSNSNYFSGSDMESIISDFEDCTSSGKECRESSPVPFLATDFLEVELNIQEDTPKLPSNDNDVHSDSSCEVEAAIKLDKLCAVPRLHEIQVADLLKRNRRSNKPRPNNPGKNKNAIAKPWQNAIICERYGTKTVNYDLLQPPPTSLKMSTLSDSSVDMSIYGDENINEKKPVKLPNQRLRNIKVDDLNLSESSSDTSSTCSTCTSTSETSSSSTSTTSTNSIPARV